MSSLIPLIIIGAIAGVAFLMKDKIASMFSNPEYTRKATEVSNRLKSNYDNVFQEYAQKKEAFAHLAKIVENDTLVGILSCKKQRSVASAMSGAMKTIASGVVKVEVGVKYYLLIGEKAIYNIQIEDKTKKGEILKTFERSEVEKITIKKGTITDNLKQAQKFKTSDGGSSGDGADNSKLMKVKIETTEKTEEFFCYKTISLGVIDPTSAIAFGSALATKTEEDIMNDMLTYTIPRKSLEKMELHYNGERKNKKDVFVS